MSRDNDRPTPSTAERADPLGATLAATERADPLGATLAATERFCPKCERSFAESLTHCPDDEVLLVLLGDEVDQLVGKNIRGLYTLREPIGEGGMGVVYLAWQHSVGREVAIKVMSPRVNRKHGAAKRFFREAKLASRLSHPNIVTIHDFGQDENRLFYLVMELLQGVTLSEALVRGEDFDLKRVFRVVEQLCGALEAAHEAAVVHRDLKPGNIIMVRKPGVRDFLKVLDFGIAKSLDGQETTLTQSGALLGTPAYFPPELALDGTSDARSDLYSLGVIAYQLLAGRLPFVSDDMRTMIDMHATATPPALPDHVPAAIAAVVYKLLRKDPENRYQTAAAARDAFVRAFPSADLPHGTVAVTAAEDLLATAPGTPTAREDGRRSNPVHATRTLPPDPWRPSATPLGDSVPRRVRAPAILSVVVAAGVAAFFIISPRPDSAPPVRPVTVPAASLAPLDATLGAVVDVDATPANADAARKTVRLQVTARGATIFIDGLRIASDSAAITVPQSDTQHFVRVVQRGYREWTAEVTADRDQHLQPRRHRLRGPKPQPTKPDRPPESAPPWLSP